MKDLCLLIHVSCTRPEEALPPPTAADLATAAVPINTPHQPPSVVSSPDLTAGGAARAIAPANVIESVIAGTFVTSPSAATAQSKLNLAGSSLRAHGPHHATPKHHLHHLHHLHLPFKDLQRGQNVHPYSPKAAASSSSSSSSSSTSSSVGVGSAQRLLPPVRRQWHSLDHSHCGRSPTLPFYSFQA